MKSIVSAAKASDDDQLIRALSEEMPVGVSIMQDGRFCYVNTAFPMAIGYTVEELIGKDTLELVHPEDRETVKKNTISMLKGELLSPYQFRITCKDGTIAWVMSTVKSIQYRGRRAILGNYMEITGRKQMEQALKESEERYKELADSITDVFFAMDDRLRCTYWNKASEMLTGIRAEDAVGRYVSEILPNMPGTKQAELVYREVLTSKKPQTFVTDYDIAGRRYIFEISAYPSRGGVSAFLRDITEQRLAEEALKQSEERYRTILDEMEEGYYEVDLAGTFTFVNDAMSRILGYSRDELIGMNYKAYTPKEHVKPVFLTYNRVYRTGEPVKWFPMVEVRSDGSQLLVEDSIFPMRNDKGEIVGFRGVSRDVTERRQAEEALRQSEERYRTILESMEDAYFEVDLGGHLTFVNDSVCRNLGYSREELLGKSYKEFTAEEDIETVYQAFNEVYRTGVPNKGCPWRTIRRDGTHGFAETSISLIKNEKGEVVGFRGVGRDITERKQAEEKLRQSKESYRALFDNSVTGTLVVDAETMRVVMGNQAAMKMFEFSSPEEGIGVSIFDYVPEDERARVYALIKEELFERNSRQTFDIQALTRAGKRIWVSATGARIMHSGRPAGLLSFTDITERKLAEERLRHSEENYKVLFESSVIGTVVLDSETGKVVRSNQAAATVFGFASADDLCGIDLLDLIHPHDREQVLLLARNSLFEHNSHRSYTVRAVSRDAREMWISVTGARILHEGRPAGLLSFLDVTQQKLQNERLAMADRLASLGELASGAAHELNNPLTSIIGFSQLLMEKEVPDDIREELKLINAEARRAAAVTENLLTFARRHPPMRELNQINGIIEDVLKLRAYEQKAKGIRVERQFDRELPEVMVDYFQMQQVFMNIIINAEYFMSNAHNGGTLTIVTRRQNQSVVILFIDDGPGIPVENLRKIFDPFFTTKEAGKGTGLGLSICHGIVTEHGGHIYARSEPGKGATIIVELPANGRGLAGQTNQRA